MKRIDVTMIRSWTPCYDPTKKVSEDWSGTVLDVLALENVSAGDKLWLVLREDLLSAKLLRLFAVSCARDVQHLMTDEELRAARDAAIGAAWVAAMGAARVAAMGAARVAAWDAARCAQIEKLRQMILIMPEEVR